MDTAQAQLLPWLKDRHLPVILFVVPVSLLLLAILIINHGMFIYTLDDPYIHLALAKHIFGGHYGINPNEYSAPSSSILWPFILAPFAVSSSALVLAPLLLNLIFAFLTVSLFVKLLGDMHPLNKLLILGGFFVATSLYGLLFTGMEHTLQVYLTALIACTVVKREFGSLTQIPASMYVALILLPLVRYEGLAVSLPVLAYLFWYGERRQAFISAAIIGVSVVGFSLFLNHLGLGYIASSVQAKSGNVEMHTVVFNITSQIDRYGWLMLAQLLLCAVFYKRKPLILMLLAVTVMITLFGRWGHSRYEIYWLTFLGVFALYACSLYMNRRLMTLLFALLPIAFPAMGYATLRVPFASAAIYNQQYYNSMIVRELHEPVAVNDLGLAALNGNQYILDLWGLGSVEALHYRKTTEDVGWMSTLMNNKNVHYAFVYNEWFPERPKNWIEVAEMRLTIPKATAASGSVFFYATDEPSAKKLKAVMEQFRDQTPQGKFTLNFPTVAVK